MDLSWASPSSDGGSAITGYIIEKQDTKRGTWSSAGTVPADKTCFTVNKLTEGNNYLFRVSSENEVGMSSPTDISTPVTVKSPYGEFLNI